MGDRSFLTDELITLLKEKNISHWHKLHQRGILLPLQRYGGVARNWSYWALMPLLGTILQWNLVKRGLPSRKAQRINYFGMEVTRLEIFCQKLLQCNFSTQTLPIRSGWKSKLWKWRIQLKIILFFWLATEYSILTWDVLQKKGWVGPGICYLCREATEDSAHLFIHCQFTQVGLVKLFILSEFEFLLDWPEHK
jgi:hypothetical protein